MKVVVFGSINMDLVVTSPHLPQPGETLSGHAFFTAPGGKGANQAVAAARLGAETVMVGRLGDDSFARPLLDNLEANGVDVTQIETDTAVSSGVALITVDERGENTIVVVGGANGRVGSSEIDRLTAVLQAGDILLLQLEIPLTAVVSAANIAAQKEAMIILDPAPAQPLPKELIQLVDILTPNETEAGILSGVPVQGRASAETAVYHLQQLGARQLLIKMGGAGAIWAGENKIDHLSAYQVDVVDTVAAGDAFNGGLAAGLCAGLDTKEALQWALAAGGLATTKRGAQAAMPTRQDLLELLASQPKQKNE